MADIVNRVQTIDVSSQEAYGNPDNCTYNLSDSGPIQPIYNVETAIELCVTNISFPNVLTAVQPFNSGFNIIGGGLTSRATLPLRNFTGIQDVASELANTLVGLTSANFTVTANKTTNKLTIKAPPTLQGTYIISFTNIAGFANISASACKLLGFRKTDPPITLTPNSVVTSTVPCAISGPMNIYMCTDLYSPEASTIDLFNSTSRGSVIAKLTLTDPPWTISSYQDPLKAFTLRLPACNLNTFTVFLLNEEKELCGLPLDYSMTLTCTYYKPSPLIEMNQKLDGIQQTLTYLWLQTKHHAEDQRKQAKLQAKAAADLEAFQGRAIT
ncbi:MAG: hypothetical protein ACOYBT_10490, partial [Polynucleobacter sp.]